MSKGQESQSREALNSLARFAFDADELVEDASREEIQSILREQGTDPTLLVRRMRQLLLREESELKAAEMASKRAAFLLQADMTTELPSFQVMRETIVNFGYAARLTEEMTEQDVQALYQQVEILRRMGEEE